MCHPMIRWLFWGLLACLMMSAAAQACSRTTVQGAGKIVPPEARIDAALIDAAVRAEVNYHRCKAGLTPVGEARGLRKVAANHAKWMARTQNLSHKSSTPGQKTAMARLKASGLRVRAGAENIGVVSRYQFDGMHFQIKDAQSCRFTTSGGAVIPPNSYASLARQIVTLWMGSSGHRRNILDRRMARLGSGAAFDQKAKNCGKFYVSQTFAG